MRKSSSMFAIATVALTAASSHGLVLENFEAETTTWVVNGAAGGNLSSLSNSTEDPFAGDRSLKIVDTNAGQPYVEWTTSHGDLSALSTTYLEFAIKLQNPQSGWLGTNALQFYFGTNNVNRNVWIVKEQAFLDIAPDANGWYVVHLELDGDGKSTVSGAMLNGNAVAEANVLAGTIGTVNWSSISYISVLPNQASGSDVWTTYVDQIVIGEAAVPEPASMVLLGLGVLAIAARRRH